jgi:hypothetical protein
LTGWSPSDLKRIDLDPKQNLYTHIPTGLMAAGFLANVAMLNLDRVVADRVERAQVASFPLRR